MKLLALILFLSALLSPTGVTLDTGMTEYGLTFTVRSDTARHVYVQLDPIAANYTTWNGYTFLPPDLGFVGGGFTLGTVYAMIKDPLGNFYIAGNFVGTAYAASVGTIVNTGRSQTYPALRLRNLGAGTARIYQLLNTTTNAGIYLNYVMLAGENALLTLTPGQRSFQSSARGNIFGLILPGSNLATWSLLPGTNYVSFFSDSGSIEASFFWQPRGWSIDSGTVQ